MLLIAVWIHHDAGDDSNQHRPSHKALQEAKQAASNERAVGGGAELIVPREQLHGFLASLTIYELPHHVIYTGLMVMPFRTVTEGDGVRWDGGGGEGMCERVKYCRQTPPAAAETVQSKEGRGREGRGGDSAGTKTRSKLQRMQELRLYNVLVGALPQEFQLTWFIFGSFGFTTTAAEGGRKRLGWGHAPVLLQVCAAVDLSHPPSVCLSLRQSFYLSVCPPVCLTVCFLLRLMSQRDAFLKMDWF